MKEKMRRKQENPNGPLKRKIAGKHQILRYNPAYPASLSVYVFTFQREKELECNARKTIG